MRRKIFILIFLLMVCGLKISYAEFNLATGKTESLLINSDQEEGMGASAAATVDKQFKTIEDVDINERVKKILNKIVKVCDRRDLVYVIKVIDEKDINAVSLPGGYIYVFKGLIDKVKNDGQLASVIAHEVGHITARHSVKRIQAAYGAMLLQLGSMAAGGRVASGVGLALDSIFSEYSQQDEFEADELGFKYLTKAGYDAKDMLAFFEILQKENNKKIGLYNYFRTHPYIGMRISNIRAKMKGGMEFREYLNLTGEKS
ncbi:MAG: M48 family metalloprotease [Candidatus Omnitrophica bacterium]|nr:M48 family metalloprotease [Candidatus Omnitrophota bacterium]